MSELSGNLSGEKNLEEIVEQIIAERESQIVFHEGDNLITKYMDEQDSTIRPRLVELFKQEIEALSTLDLNTATLEDIRIIEDAFRQRRNSIKPRAQET